MSPYKMEKEYYFSKGYRCSENAAIYDWAGISTRGEVYLMHNADRYAVHRRGGRGGQKRIFFFSLNIFVPP